MLNSYVSRLAIRSVFSLRYLNFDSLGYSVDLYIFPLFRRPLPILRMTIGFILISLSMSYATILQHLINTTSPCHGCPSTINIWFQSPIYVLVALSEIFTSITGFGYAYEQAPGEMKSGVMAFYLVMTTFGSGLNAILS